MIIEGVITDVIVKDLHVNNDERGRLFEILRNDDPFYQKFGQVYVTTAKPGIVKAWHKHEIQTDHFSVIKGTALFGLHDARVESSTHGITQIVVCMDTSPKLIVIPPRVLHGFVNIGTEDVICVNCPTEPYNRLVPDEEHTDPYRTDIGFNWR